jgi:hypothetical protein
VTGTVKRHRKVKRRTGPRLPGVVPLEFGGERLLKAVVGEFLERLVLERGQSAMGLARAEALRLSPLRLAETLAKDPKKLAARLLAAPTRPMPERFRDVVRLAIPRMTYNTRLALAFQTTVSPIDAAEAAKGLRRTLTEIKNVRAMNKGRLSGRYAQIREFLGREVQRLHRMRWSRARITRHLNDRWGMAKLKTFYEENDLGQPRKITEKVVRTILRAK